MYFVKPVDPNPITPLTRTLLILLCGVWLLTGLFGHAPWKPDELTHFGVVYGMLHDGHWLVPTVVDQPVLNYSPGYYWVAAMLAQLCSPWLALHDGARLASGLFMLLTFICLGHTARFLYGAYRGWGAVVILMGCVGLLVRAHQLSPEVALLFAVALLLYGFAWYKESPRRAVFTLTAGVSLGFLTYGLSVLAFFFFVALALPLVLQSWRKIEFVRVVVYASLFSLPFVLAWPLGLYFYDAQLFDQWWYVERFEPWQMYWAAGLGLGVFYYLKNIAWLAWPALPLALWVLWFSRHQWRIREDLQLPLVMFLCMMIVLSFASSVKAVFALPMLVPLSLLAAAALPTLKRGAANALDWFGLATFALLAIAMWWGWVGLLRDSNSKIASFLKAYHPSYIPEFDVVMFVCALLASIVWLVLVWRTGRSMRRAVLNWASGMTLVWVLGMTLWLPWLDSGKSYRGLSQSIAQVLPQQNGCVGQGNLSLGVRAMLYYYANLRVVSDRKMLCSVQLLQGENARLDTSWRLIWSGRRTQERGDVYSVYVRQ